MTTPSVKRWCRICWGRAIWWGTAKSATEDDASFYGWMGQPPYMISSLQHTLEEIQHPRLLSVTITHKDELYQVLQTFLQPQENTHV